MLNMLNRMDLGGRWSLTELKITDRKFNPEKIPGKSLAAQVPGNVWQDLLAAKKIAHPFYHLNNLKLAWIEERTWCYRKTFRAPAQVGGRAELVFEGLDTFARIYLNGRPVGTTNNMFHPWRFDVTDTLLAGKANDLVVVFDPWRKFTKGKDVTDQWSAFDKERVWTRKAQMETGWDWGPRMVMSGIWRPVRLEIVDSVRLASWHFKTLKADAKNAVVELEVQLDRVSKKPVEVEITLRNGGQKISGTVTTSGSAAKLRLTVPEPKLWWPRNIGKPNLYEITILARIEGQTVDQIKAKSGIRTVELIQKPQGGGCKSFTFAVNGKKVFLAGADWIPAHNFLSSVTPERYRRHLQAAADANMNAIRVWGGGIYEDEAFYNICDELGLCVWQDFMFACAFYPGNDAEFLANVENEFRQVIPRLRVHPSIVLWNGNNENQWIDDQVFWKKPKRKMPDRGIYHDLLPKVTKQLDGTRPYWPSSPFGGNDHNDWRQGNHHSWQVWGGGKVPRKFGENPGHPDGTDISDVRHYKHYADVVPRFCSEYGIHGLPYQKTLAAYLSPHEMKLNHKALYYRNKAGEKLDIIQSFLKYITGWAKDYKELELKSQLAQARGLQFGIKHHRRNLWQCSGSLIWQLNDCWPGFSWSLLDYDVLPKPSYFAVKRAFAPLMLSIACRDERYQLWAVNTSGKAWKATVRFKVQTFTGKVLGQGKVNFNLAGDTSKMTVGHMVKACGLKDFDPATSYLKAEVIGGTKTSAAWCLADPIHLNLPKTELKTSLKVKKIADQYRHEVTVAPPKTFAYFVGVIPPTADCRFEDNFINIDPDAPATIVFTAPRKYDLKQLKIRGFNC
jgi:beta-mannosidase